MDAKRVVLVEPGDVLLIGNVGQPEDVSELLLSCNGLTKIGIPAFMFRGPIAIDRLDPSTLRDTVERVKAAAAAGG